ncbi:hypothetical protein BKA66DRAFT_408599 [Pyrenochaeta sp. MPI-SDFR-AT-0127]|nr:hypothetical protein BKA66DRAFT_408599 [Pyrenochaeta sp. MPI-SDFR-AT-0127]
MPRFLQPKQSTQHRVAAIALYRALLSRCASTPLSDDDRVSLRNAIQNKFRKNKKLQSPYQLGLSFKAGYETLDHLDASVNGDVTSVDLLVREISTLPQGLTRKPPRPRCPRPSSKLPKERFACLPTETAVLNVRPYAKTSGPRHVPMIASANGVPFLRLTKPQPASLSRILRQRLDHKQRLFDMKIFLANWWMPICKQEDVWDDLIAAQVTMREDRVKWVDAIHLAERENQRAYDRDVGKDRTISRKMQRIVDLETEMALKEGQTIVRGRKKRPIRVIKP